MRWLIISGSVAAAGLMALALTASEGDSPSPSTASNYRTTVSGADPALPPRVEVRAVDGDGRLELVNSSDRPVTVLGYNGEPFLRVTEGGVDENVRSPSLYLDGREAPPDAHPEAAPEWRRTDGGSSVRWHDHRAHWMGRGRPAEVAAEPGRRHLISTWEVPLRVEGRPATVTGELTWVPPPRPWPWALGAGAVAAAVVVAGLAWRRGRAAALPGALVGLVASAALLAGGRWAASAGGATDRLGLLALPLLALAPAATTRLLPPNTDERNRLLLLAASVTSLGGLYGVSHLSWLARSQLPTGLAPTLARLAVAAALGTAAGALVVLVGRALSASPARTGRPVPAGEPAPAAGGAASGDEPGPPPASGAGRADRRAAGVSSGGHG